MPDGSTLPRWLDRDGLARYLSLRPSAVGRLVDLGRLPKPCYTLGPKLPRWDREMVDAAFDGGLASIDADRAIHALAQEIRQGR